MKQDTILFKLKHYLSTRSRQQIGLYSCSIAAVVLLFTYLILFNKSDLEVFPNNTDLEISFYTDLNDQGKSVIHHSKVLDTTIELEFELKKGFISPYAGFTVSYKNHKTIDVSSYNRMDLELDGKNVKNIDVYLQVKDKDVKDTTSKVALRHLMENIKLTKEQKAYDIDFKAFTTPDWWYIVVGQPKSEFSIPSWKALHTIAFTSGFHPLLDKPCTISLHKIRFYRDNTWTIVYFVLIQLLVMTVVAFWVFRNKPEPNKAIAVNISYTAVSVEEKTKTSYSFLDYIHEHFTDSDLTLAQISKNTGVNQRFISDTISEKFDCNLKTYINQIRVNEAKRLLKESDLNISEIAYKVGFSSPGSFNRVFKNLTGSTPSDIQNTDL